MLNKVNDDLFDSVFINDDRTNKSSNVNDQY